MSERINISIPDDLYERLSHVKDKLNVSKLCQEAIKHAVRVEEVRAKAMADIESLVERLKEEELQYGKKYIDEGFECGVKDAFGLSLDDLLHVAFNKEMESDLDETPFLPSSETTNTLEEFEDRVNGVMEGERNMTTDTTPGIGWMLNPTRYFICGWQNGVNHICEKVKGDLIGIEEEDLYNLERRMLEQTKD